MLFEPFLGLGDEFGTATPVKGRNPTTGATSLHSLINRRRAQGERGFATPKAWKIFTKVRCCPHRIGPMAKAVFTLQLGPKRSQLSKLEKAQHGRPVPELAKQWRPLRAWQVLHTGRTSFVDCQ
ncbi:MAG TPA: hypothetical protein DGG94_07135 [Micromonosporaceae bacterium]|nr:hypothetical protein [Micromonosporaceae bacterium]HCU49560.1 hypothetical protein [Micromonosporaceae bacterium]